MRKASRETPKITQVPESQKSLLHISAKEQQHSKNQKLFNNLISQVEQLKNQITSESRKLETLLENYNATVPKLEKRYAEAQLAIARSLDRATDKVNLGNRDTESVRSVILWFCKQAFARQEPDEAAKNLYSKWAPKTYEQEQQDRETATKKKISADVKELYGLNIHFSEIDISDEGLAQLRQLIREHLAKQLEEKAAADEEKPKSKKQQQREQKRKSTETEKLKSIRSIYLSLAKLLHPDTATDAAEKMQKEELMKKITAAYQKKDLPALLKLELDFVASESSKAQFMADEKLKNYIASLKEQVRTLESDLLQTRLHPRFSEISDLAPLPEKIALNQIKSKEKFLKGQIQEATKVSGFLQQSENKKSILSFVLSMEEEISNAL